MLILAGGCRCASVTQFTTNTHLISGHVEEMVLRVDSFSSRRHPDIDKYLCKRVKIESLLLLIVHASLPLPLLHTTATNLTTHTTAVTDTA